MELLQSYDSGEECDIYSNTEPFPIAKRRKQLQEHSIVKQEPLFHPKDGATNSKSTTTSDTSTAPAGSHGDIIVGGVVPGAYVSKRKLRKATANDTAAVSAKGSTDFKSPELDSYLLSDEGAGMISGCGCRSSTKCPYKWEGHKKVAECLDWHPCYPNLLLSAGFDGLCKIWDVPLRPGDTSCLMSHPPHSAQAVSTAKWLSTATGISGGYDNSVVTTDYIAMRQSGRRVHTGHVTTLRPHPSDQNLFVSGDAHANVCLWDIRTEKPVSNYLGAGGRVLDLEFINRGKELVGSADIVRKNAGSKMLLVWETSSAIVKSRQIYNEPFTCPCLRTVGSSFLAQSNAGYIIIFNANTPFKLSKYKRFEGHMIEGYRTQFDVSPDHTHLCSASADGKLYYYQYRNTRQVRSIYIGPSPTIAVVWHPFISSRVACSSWDGTITVCD